MHDTVRVLIKSPKFIIGVAVLVIVISFAAFYPMVNKSDPFEMQTMPFSKPNSTYLLGSDNFGRDVLLSLAHGCRNSMTIGLLAGLIATLIGVSVGLTAGYCGGALDETLVLFTNLFTVIPPLVIMILVSISFDNRSIWMMALLIGITNWPWTARSVRAQTASLRNREHIKIARISGMNTFEIILLEVLPYIASYVFMALIIQVGVGILLESALSMIGLGPFNAVSLGKMLNWAISFLAPSKGAWWAFLPTALTIGLVTFALHLINMGMDEIFDPKLRS